MPARRPAALLAGAVTLALTATAATGCLPGRSTATPQAPPPAAPVAPAAPVVEQPAPAPVIPAPGAPAPPAPPVAPGPRTTWRPLPPSVVVDATAFGADGADAADDTDALRRALAEGEGRPVYLPRGTYLVSGELVGRRPDGTWRGGLHLVGEDRDATVLRLVDGAPGYGDPAAPAAVVRTASYSLVEAYGSPVGEGNEAYGNNIENLTIDTGNNPGAIALDYLANNMGAVRHVTLRGQGPTGLSLERRYPGPALLGDVRVEGFGTGIAVAHSEYGLTLDGVELAGQRDAGIANDGNVLAVSGLRSDNAVPAVVTSGSTAFVALHDAELRGGSAGTSAVLVGAPGAPTAGAVLRDVRTTGYRSALTADGAVVDGVDLASWASASTGGGAPLDLAVPPVPEHVETDLTRWAAVTDFGATGDDWLDDTDAVQAALDSGATAVSFPAGRYFISRPLRVGGAVRVLQGFGASLAPAFDAFSRADSAAPMLVVGDGTGESVTVDSLSIGKLHQASPIEGLVCVEQATSRALVLRDVACDSAEVAASYRNTGGAGQLFLENVILVELQLSGGQSVWARQLDTESSAGPPRITNDGAQLWVLGLKTEGGGTVVATSGGGRTEVLGGLVYPARPVDAGDAAFTTDGSPVSLSYATSAHQAGWDYATQVAGPAPLPSAGLPGRTGFGHAVVQHATG